MLCPGFATASSGFGTLASGGRGGSGFGVGGSEGRGRAASAAAFAVSASIISLRVRQRREPTRCTRALSSWSQARNPTRSTARRVPSPRRTLY